MNQFNCIIKLADKFILVSVELNVDDLAQELKNLGLSAEKASSYENTFWKSLNIEPKYIQYLKNKQYWLLPWDLRQAVCGDNAERGSDEFWSSVQGKICNEFNQSLAARQKNLLDQNGNPITDTQYIMKVQHILKSEKFGLGTTGTNKDGVDGIWGRNSHKALFGFQVRYGLDVTGTLTLSTKSELGLS